MRKLVHFVHTSLDGFVDGPNGEFDWPQMGPELSAYSFGLDDRSAMVLYGRVVWEMMASYWPIAESVSDHPHDLAYAPKWRAMPKVVASRTLQEAEHGARVIGTDLPTEVAELKQGDGGDVLLMGGSRLAASLMALGLVDEVHVGVHPVVLGGGKPFLPPAEGRYALQLLDSRVCDGQVVLSRYRTA
ncbi:MAG: dihydrofolate reductase family protein [Pseudonocardia sp.]|nr:dihydrofolate reductase family protein [Pseudonocardia sp.]